MLLLIAKENCRLYTAFNCLFFSVSFDLEQFLILALSFMTLTFWKSAVQFFFIEHFSLGISLIFIHDLMEVMHFSARGLQKCFVHPIKEHMMSVCPTAGVNSDYLTPQ